MSQIPALELKVEDIVEGPHAYSMGFSKVRSIRVVNDERLITWAWGIKMNFAMNEANYSTERNPIFNVVNR